MRMRMLIACKLIVWEFGNVIWMIHGKEILQRKGIRVEVKQEIAWHCRRMEIEITSLD